MKRVIAITKKNHVSNILWERRPAAIRTQRITLFFQRNGIISGRVLLLFILSFLSFSAFGATTPLMKVKIAQYSNALHFSLPGGGTWELGSKKGKILEKDSLQVTARLEKPAEIKFHVMVESVPMRDPDKVEKALAKWKATGRPIHTKELGKRSFHGKTVTYDGRVLFIGVGSFFERKSAQDLVDELAGKEISSWIMEEILQLSQGQMLLKINGGEIAAGSGPLLLLPRGIIKLAKVEHAMGFSWHGFQDRSYRGKMSISFGARDALDCVLALDLESMLAGVVPSEISSNAHPNSLCAQAIAARGEILSKMALRHVNEGFDFCAEQHCQVFAGETAASLKVASATHSTRGLVLVSPDGAIVDAVYSANCGGHTEPNHLVWTSPPDPQLSGTWDTPKSLKANLTKEADVRSYILNAPKAFCNAPKVEGGDKFRWSKTITAKEWKTVEENGKVGKIKKIGNFKRGPSGRLFSITLSGAKAERTIMKELNIRKLFGMLRSACFIVTWKTDKKGYIQGAKFTGAGWGHGVGMCQTGAQNMGKLGSPFKKILAHYFPGSKLVKWY